MLSGPVALWWFKFFSRLATPSMEIEMGGISGKGIPLTEGTDDKFSWV